ncbi:MAG: hypothetical protein RLZZ32_1801 [Cyanobacteriota bacterium]|jgi:hypothetical protein
MSLLSGPLELIWGMAGLMKALLLDPPQGQKGPARQGDRNRERST